MNWFENNINRMLGGAGVLGIVQFVGQLRDYLADGHLDNHEIQQLFLSTTSSAQTIIIVAVVVYMKFFKKDKE